MRWTTYGNGTNKFFPLYPLSSISCMQGFANYERWWSWESGAYRFYRSKLNSFKNLLRIWSPDIALHFPRTKRDFCHMYRVNLENFRVESTSIWMLETSLNECWNANTFQVQKKTLYSIHDNYAMQDLKLSI